MVGKHKSIQCRLLDPIIHAAPYRRNKLAPRGKRAEMLRCHLGRMIEPLESRTLLSALPDLTPYQPSGWSAPIVATTVSGNTTDSTPIATNQTLYVDWAVINNGAASASGTFCTQLYVDGTCKGNWSTGSLNAGSWTQVKNYSIGALSGGKHTIEIITDANNAIVESNENDNTYTKTVTVVTPLAAPTGLTAKVSGSAINLAWTSADKNATGFYVLRSANNLAFSTVATLTSIATTSWSDTNVVPGDIYDYRVQAYNAVTCSALSNTASAMLPVLLNITKRHGSELVINVVGGNDTVRLDQKGSTLTVVGDGLTYTDPIGAGGIYLYTHGGTDSITIDSDVKAFTTLETIDDTTGSNGQTTITSAGSDVYAWIDATDTFTGTGTVNRVASFAGGVSKASGAALPNPSDSGTVVTTNLSMWGAGPVAGDINQGEVGDCYFLSSLAAFAGLRPAVLLASGVDMGDGTYVVRYLNNGSPTYVRVNNQLPQIYAHVGTDNAVWGVVFEKAFAYFRTGANTYASINSGWLSEVYTDLGINSANFGTTGYTDASLFAQLSTALSSDEPVTLCTPGDPIPPIDLVEDHCYTLIRVYVVAGVNYYEVRNPWGVSGDKLENSQGYADLTFAQMVANFSGICIAVG